MPEIREHIQKRYRNDSQFHACVDAFLQTIKHEGWTIQDFNDAIELAFYLDDVEKYNRRIGNI